MMFQRLLINVDAIRPYLANFLEELLKEHGAYMISAERYVKLTQDERTLDYLLKREQPVE